MQPQNLHFPAGETKTTTEALEAITRQLENLLRSADFDPYANSQILQALSVLGYQPEPRFLDIVARRALAELQAGSLENASEGCVQLVGALAVHRHNHNEFMQVMSQPSKATAEPRIYLDLWKCDHVEVDQRDATA